MSIIPLMDWMVDEPMWYRQPRSLFDQSFGWDIHPRDLRQIMMAPPSMRRPLSSLTRDNEIQLPIVGKDGFQICMDVAQFKPNEITVKTTDKEITVEGKHEERQDEHGYISRQFTRKYALPKGYDPNSVVSSLSSDGVLSIKAPPPQKMIENNERIICIQHTGPAKTSIKPNPEKK